MFSKIAIASLIGALAILQAVDPALAEVSQEDQDRAAIAANQASSEQLGEVAREAEAWKRGAEIIRDTAVEIEKALIEKALE